MKTTRALGDRVDPVQPPNMPLNSGARSPSAAGWGISGTAVLCCCWSLLLLASRPTAVEGFAVIPRAGLPGTRHAQCAATGANPTRTASCLFLVSGGGVDDDDRAKGGDPSDLRFPAGYPFPHASRSNIRMSAMKFLRGGSDSGVFGSNSGEDIKTQVPDSIIGETLSVQGTVEFKHLLRIDGHFEGEVVGDGSLIIGPTAEVISNLSGLDEVYVEGILIGDCSCNKMQIRGAGCVTGNLMTGSLGMDPSVVLKGSANVDKLRSRTTSSPSKSKDESSSDSDSDSDSKGGGGESKPKAKEDSSSSKKKEEKGGGGWAPPPMTASTSGGDVGAAAAAAKSVRASVFSKLMKLGGGGKEADEEGTPHDAALVYGHKKLASTPTLAEFSTEPAFPTAETLFLLGRAHDEGREDVGIQRDEDAARELYESAAKLGYPEAQHALSVILASSGEDEVEAILYDFFASLGGDPLAHAALGYRYLYGIGTPQNCQQSLLHYHMAAREVIADLHTDGRGGIARAVDRTRLSDRFVAGRRPASDTDRELVDLWAAAAETGDLHSIRAMGVLHQHGVRGVEQDFEKSFEMFQKGAELRDLHSTSHAANLLMRGAGTPPDYEAALRMFRMSRTTHVSLNGLGYLYFHGLGVEKDVAKAMEFFLKAQDEDKDKQNSDVLFNMGLLYLTGNEDVRIDGEMVYSGRDAQKALTYLNAAANMGHVEAMFQAALLYADGEEPLTISRCTSAVKLMKNVVERGPWMENMRAALRRATAGDYGGALVLYSRLAEIGFEVAQSNAAWLLDAGHCGGGAVNGTKVGCEKRALRLYEHAARQGRASAEMKIGDFHYHGKADLPVDYEKAAERYLKASDARNAEALFGMGYMHQTGKGVPQDLFLAKRYFDEAATVSTDAVPVARLSLLLLRLQSRWISWRDWWSGPRQQDGEANDDKDRASGDGSDGESLFSVSEMAVLFCLVVLLGLVMVERRERAGRRRSQQQ
eukprot:g6166.t1